MALKEMRVSSYVLVLRQSVFQYEVDHVLWKNKDSFLKREIQRIAAIFMMPWRFDIIHYNFGTTLAMPPFPFVPGEDFLKSLARRIYFFYTFSLQFLELLILKIFRKPIFMHYQGDDARQGTYSLKNFDYSPASVVDESYYNPTSDAYKQRSIRRMDMFCSKIYALNPDLLHVLPVSAEFLPYSHIDLSEWTPVYSTKSNHPLRIGHAPSNRAAKGTNLIIDALNSLEKKGYSFEFVLIEGLSNSEARKKYETVDLLVDQLFAGWYGGLAVEAMALGKPVLVYLREKDFKFIPKQMVKEFPFIQVCPETIQDGLEKVLNMTRDELINLGKLSRTYVENWHDPLYIVSNIKRDYEKALGIESLED